MAPERLHTPRPFVCGGNLSNYVTHSRTATTSSTSTSVAGVKRVDEMSSIPEDPVEAEETPEGLDLAEFHKVLKRAQNPPERSMNLVELARFLEQSMDSQSDDESEEESEDEELEENEKENAIDGVEDSSPKSLGTLEIAKPVVYEGTFKDYKKEAFKFVRFKTLSCFNRAVEKDAHNAVPVPQQSSSTAASTTSQNSSQRLAECSSDSEDLEIPSKKSIILDCPSPTGHLPCQLLALASPPGKSGSVFATVSDAVAISAMKFAHAAQAALDAEAAAKTAEVEALGDVATVKSADAAPDNEVNEVPSMPMRRSEASVTFNQKFSGKSVHRFNFKAHELENIDAALKGGTAWGRDDGSSWIVDQSSAGPYSLPKYSGSSWGSSGRTLEPLCQGKISLDQPTKVTLPKLSGAWMQSPTEQTREVTWLRRGEVGHAVF